MTGICPVSLIPDSIIWLFRHIMRLINSGIPPTTEHGAGFLDQASLFCQSVDLVQGIINQITDRKMKEATEDGRANP